MDAMTETNQAPDLASRQLLRIELPPRWDAAQLARRALEARFGDVLRPGGLQALLLVVSELVNNSVQHGRAKPIQLRISADKDAVVRGEILDDGCGAVAIRDPSTNPLDGGLGLRLVDALVDRWGVRDGSTNVWFEMTTERDDWTDTSAYLPWM
jgi:anti-sigma regulatory factor (Ser/Thr protein kinase)